VYLSIELGRYRYWVSSIGDSSLYPAVSGIGRMILDTQTVFACDTGQSCRRNTRCTYFSALHSKYNGIYSFALRLPETQWRRQNFDRKLCV